MNALDLLNEDCWIEVLDRVRNPEDLKACSETCLVFERILRNKKIGFLFDLIIPAIFEYLVDRQVSGDDGVEPEEEDDWRHALFSCRAVCKDWCKSIDEFAETNSFMDGTYWFDSGERTEPFLKMFETHNGNPIIGRSVTIVHDSSTLLMAQPQDDVQNEDAPYDEIFHVTNIRQLLNRFGKEIRTLDLIEEYTEDRFYHYLALCKNIQPILSHLPNLRNLRLCVYEQDNLEDMEEMDQAHIYDELTTYITANPLPPLPYLEGIDIHGLNLVMMRSMLEKYSSQLKYLTACWDPTCFTYEFPRFSCLNELDLQDLDATTSLQYLRELHSPLEKLSLSIDAFSDPNQLPVWPIDELFRNIQHLPIRKLKITNDSELFVGESAPISPDLRVRHESIHEVCIICWSGSVSLNLLAYCPNLEEFAIYHFDSPLQQGSRQLLPGHPNNIPELFDVIDLMKKDDLYQSDIWEAIPGLNKFSLATLCGIEDPRRGTHYHRKTYEEKRENGNDA